MEHSVVTTVIAIVALILIAALSAVGLRRVRLPYSVGLVIVGLVLGAVAERWEPLAFVHDVRLSPDVILFVFLPTLIFESAFNLDARLLSQNLVPVLALAAPGLLVSTILIGVSLAVLTPLGLGAALVFGALISATDPVAVVALFKELGAPKRLAILVEGESLFNDATAIVVFNILTAVVLVGAISVGAIGEGVFQFGVVFLGGLVVGGIVGYVMVRSITLAESDPMVEVALSTVVAYAAFIVAEHYLHVSGVMATVGAGVVVGAFGTPRFRPQVRAFLNQFWEYAAFLANGLIFLLVGLAVSLDGLVRYAGPIGWAILAAVVARGVVTFGMVPMVGQLPGAERIDWRYRTVLWWGGLRGAVALALALSLANNFPDRDLVIAMAVGVVLFTLLTGGLSMGRVLRTLGLDKPSLVERVARAQAKSAAKHEALTRIARMATAGHFSSTLVDQLDREYRAGVRDVHAELRELQRECAMEEVQYALWLEALAVEQATYRDLLDNGFISEPVLRELELALALQRDEFKRGAEGWTVDSATPLEVRITAGWYRVLESIAPKSRWIQRHRLRALAARYERDAAVFDASGRVQKEVRRLADLSATPARAAAVVEGVYQARERRAMERLDWVAEHFPEYVHAVQLQTARRIALDGEADAIESLATAGGIPASVAEGARRAVDRAQRGLARQPVAALEPRPIDLLQQIPFFKDLGPSDFKQIIAKLTSRTVLAGDTIIKEGERGKSLFLIARGVVGVYKTTHGELERIASLYAGDFFGEMALLTEQPRSATVRAVTDCQLYELTRRNVDLLCEVCEGARQALLAAARERQTLSNSSNVNA